MASTISQQGVCTDPRCDDKNDRQRQLFFCSDCKSCLQLKYKEYLQCARLEKILMMPATELDLEELHSQDRNTTWFGIDRFQDDGPFLQDFDTFKQLIKDSPNPDQIRYPQLVSFIGETSAGKSTLIKMLIEYDQAKYEANKSMFKAPVPGSPLHDSTPTSADVHLYVDPATWEEERSIFYADCEGLNAGERIPIGAHSRRQTKIDTSRKLGLRARSLEWATSDQTRTRQYAVTQLYPRLLYTFSDVVVFVLNNSKTFEHNVLPKLLDWASSSLEASTNQVGLLSSAEDLSFYIQKAFTHFSKDLNHPFDFKSYSLIRNPIPQNLGGHILRVAIVMQRQYPNRAGEWIFENLSFMVASCFLYDCATYRKGKPHDLFADYQPNFEDALVEFCSSHWPCEFFHAKRGRCVNVSKSHEKGHQTGNRGKVTHGHYMSSFTAEDYKNVWLNSLKSRLHDVQEELERKDDSSEETGPLGPIRRLHARNISSFYRAVGGASKFNSHATCLCCLMRPPEHVLRCGHVLCTECVKAFGTVRNCTMEMKECPLHIDDCNWRYPWRIRMKPDFAGVRILSLDGGGIRGIAELEVLCQIQEKLGVNIPISAFFDLIVGTSTGGIIALALAVKQWSVNKCIEEFKRLVKKAFSPREFHGIAPLQYIATASHGSTWKTTPFHEALLESLGDGYLFGGAESSDNVARVAVTTTDEVATRGIVIANYCRKSPKDDKQSYEFLRPSEPDAEMRTWHAGAATAAATPFFKPFVHPFTGETYLDGAFYNNNPVKVGNRERQLLWPDVQDNHPDLLLSIGTSQHQQAMVEDFRSERFDMQRNIISSLSHGKAKIKATSKVKHLAGMFQYGKAAINKLGDSIHCERQWEQFLDGMERSTAHSEDSRRYVRINPDIGRTPPRLDDVNEVDRLQLDVSRYLKGSEAMADLEDVVFRLVASSFYFERTHATRDMSQGAAKVKGRLQCRFEESSDWAKQMGLFFKKHQRADFQPYFDTWDGNQQHGREKINLDSSRIERMASHGALDVQEVELTVATSGRDADIRLHLHTSTGRTKGYSISGFPRDFFREIDRVEVENEVEGSPKDSIPKPVTLPGIPSINVLSGKGTALLRPGAPGSTSDQNLSTQPHVLNEEDRRKSDDVLSRATLEKVSRDLSLKEKLSSLSLRGEERRSHWIGSSKGIRRDKSPLTQEHEQQALPNSPQHRRSFSTNSPPEQPQGQRNMASPPSMPRETAQHNGGYDIPYTTPDTIMISSLPSSIPRMSMPPANPTPSPVSNPQWQPINPQWQPTNPWSQSIYPTHTSQPPLPPATIPLNPQWQPTHPTHTLQSPLAPATIPVDFTGTAAPSSTYEFYSADNVYLSPHTTAAQPPTTHTTSAFNNTLPTHAQPNHTATQHPPMNDHYQSPLYKTDQKADLELEFALQISLADQEEEEEREEQRRLTRALEESRREAYWC
ncbi:zinc ion binding protein [Alternaria alternata]|nr:zinc ion binding protein [Alternaria alternata]